MNNLQGKNTNNKQPQQERKKRRYNSQESERSTTKRQSKMTACDQKIIHHAVYLVHVLLPA